MTFDKYRINFWRMFLVLEKELVEAFYYVDLDTKNYATTSVMFSKLILSIGSEVDNAFRECSGLTDRSDIKQYYNYIIGKFPDIVNQQVKVRDTNIILKPYDGWNGSLPSQSLVFWHKYNELKHDRVLNAEFASLETVLNALAGLFVIEMYRFDEIYRTQPDAYVNMPNGDAESKLFILNSWEEKMRCSKIKTDYSLYDEERGRYAIKA